MQLPRSRYKRQMRWQMRQLRPDAWPFYVIRRCSNTSPLKKIRLFGRIPFFLRMCSWKQFYRKIIVEKRHRHISSFPGKSFPQKHAEPGNLRIFASAAKNQAEKTIPVYNAPRALQQATPWQHRKLFASTTKPSRLLVPHLSTDPAQSFHMCRKSSKYSL